EEATVLAALIKVADADAAAHKVTEARQGYEAAALYAETAGERNLESLALAHLADVLDRSGNAADAARNYQKALGLDDASADRRAAGIDWLNYGQFLQRHGKSEPMVLACMLNAEELLRGAPQEEWNAVVQARAKSEARLGGEVESVRRNRKEFVRESLALNPESLAKSP